MRMPKTVKVLPIAGLRLFLGGAIGGIWIDRVSLGYVVDFIHVYYQNSHFPAFNIADSALRFRNDPFVESIPFFSKNRIQRAEVKNDWFY